MEDTIIYLRESQQQKWYCHFIRMGETQWPILPVTEEKEDQKHHGKMN